MFYVDGIAYNMDEDKAERSLIWHKVSEREELPRYSLGFCISSNEYRFTVTIQAKRCKKRDEKDKLKYFYVYVPYVYDWITDKNYVKPGKTFKKVEDAKLFCGHIFLETLDKLNASMYEGRN